MRFVRVQDARLGTDCKVLALGFRLRQDIRSSLEKDLTFRVAFRRKVARRGSSGLISVFVRTMLAMEPVGTHVSPPGTPLVGIIMGSQSDWSTMEHAAKALADLGVAHECRVVSAHRTPDLLFEYAASARDRGLRAIIAGAGGAAHLPGMCASKTPLPVLGVPVQSKTLSGLDSLLSIVQMPAGVPVATFAVGAPGAVNAALFAASMLAADDAGIRARLDGFRAAQTAKVLAQPDPRAALAAGGAG